MSLKPTFFTLLYIKNNNSNKNLAENSNSNIIDYVNCCEALTFSLENSGYKLNVITNNKKLLERLSKNINVVEIDFFLDVPSDIKFYAAHYKIDVYRYFASLKGYSVLIDSDVLCLNPIPSALNLLIDYGVPMYYDITDQSYPAYGRDRIIEDKEVLMGKKSVGSWVGGEFIGGSGEFFNEIYKTCITYWTNYIKHSNTFHHQGDEMLTSCAIEEYQLNKGYVFDVGTVGGISRYWSNTILHEQKTIKSSLDNFLLHLPSDKNFIARNKHTVTKLFITKYKRYLLLIKIKNTMKLTAKKILKNKNQ